LPALIRGVVPIIPLRRIGEAVEFDPFQEPEAIQFNQVPAVIQLRRVQEVIEPQPVIQPEPVDMDNPIIRALLEQNAQLLAHLGNQGANQGLRGSTMTLIPTFSGRPSESLADWEAALHRGAVSDVWNDATRRRAAITKLSGAALAWHDHSGHELLNWNDWIGGLRQVFQPRLSLTDWCTMVTQRIQRPDETSVEYAMEKAKLLRLCPHVLPEQEKVDHLIHGLLRTEQRGALLGNPPATIDAFVEAIRSLEQRSGMYGTTSLSSATPILAHHIPAAPSVLPTNGDTSLAHAMMESMRRMETIVQSALQQQHTQRSSSNWRNRQPQHQDQRQWSDNPNASNARPPSQQQDQRQWGGNPDASNARPPMQQQDQRQWNNNPMVSSARSPSPVTQQQTVTHQSRPQAQMQNAQWNGPPQRQRTPLDKVDCFRCGLMGHYQNDCPGRIATIHQGNDQASLQGQGWPTQQ